MENITASELKQKIDNGNNPVLLDVREPWEYEICRIEGSQNVPFTEIPATLATLDNDAEIIVICHHGLRSLQVAGFMESQGFQKMVNLELGIDGWAIAVEPEMSRY